jgi:hypothetical protein
VQIQNNHQQCKQTLTRQAQQQQRQQQQQQQQQHRAIHLLASMGERMQYNTLIVLHQTGKEGNQGTQQHESWDAQQRCLANERKLQQKG